MRYNGISLLFPILVTSVLNFVYIWRHTFKNTQFSKCVFSVNQQCVSLRHLMHSEKVNDCAFLFEFLASLNNMNDYFTSSFILNQFFIFF